MATLADIAKQADVSKSTVSRVLNNKPGVPISPATVERIKRTAEALGYQPNALARALATGKTQSIGLCYHNLTEPMFIRILEAAESKAREHGYHLIVSSNAESFSGGDKVDGLIYIGSIDAPCIREIAHHKPVMYVEPSDPSDQQGHGPNAVTWSEYDAGYMAAKYLAGLGHRRIGGIWGNFSDVDVPLSPRLAGFRAGLEAFGATGIDEFEEKHPDLIYRGYLQMERLMQRDQPSLPLTAVFARNDLLALGALKWLHEARISVPAEMSVMYYGNSILANAAYVELTSVSHPNAEASVLALDQLIAMIEKKAESFPGITLPILLRERDSCAPPRNYSG